MVLRLGQRVPQFSLPDSEKIPRSLKEFTDRGSVMLAFFPFAFSGTCDREMCTLRDDFVPPVGRGVQVLGVSVDSTYSLRAFAQTYNLPFPLLSDFNKRVSKAYGVLHDEWTDMGYRGVSKRAVFLINQRGMLKYRWTTEVPSDEPPYAEVMRAAQKISD